MQDLDTIQNLDTDTMLKEAIYLLQQNKALDIKNYNLGKYDAIAHYTIVSSTYGSRHTKAIGEKIVQNFKKKYNALFNIHGTSDNNWVIIDMHDVVIHIFDENLRAVYDLDTLYKERINKKIAN